MRLCQALKETHNTLKRLTDQTVSEEATLRANVLPSKKRSLAFVRAVLKYNVSPQTIDEMISNLRQMQTEILDCLRNLETSFDNVDNLHDLFQQQLERFSTYSRLSTSTTLTNRVQLVSWLGKFGERREFPQRSQNEKSKRVGSLNLFRVLILILIHSNCSSTPSFALIRTKMGTQVRPKVYSTPGRA